MIHCDSCCSTAAQRLLKSVDEETFHAYLFENEDRLDRRYKRKRILVICDGDESMRQSDLLEL